MIQAYKRLIQAEERLKAEWWGGLEDGATTMSVPEEGETETGKEKARNDFFPVWQIISLRLAMAYGRYGP